MIVLILHSESRDAARCAVMTHMRGIRIATLVLFCLSILLPLHLLGQKPAPARRTSSTATQPPVTPTASLQSALARRYQEGEKVAYKVTSVNHSASKTSGYDAHAEGAVRKTPSGSFVEDIAWTDLLLNDEQIRLSPASRAFREPLSLAPDAKLSLPNLSRVQSGLIGPITDLLTFYADVKIAMNQKGLLREGDHVRVPYGTPSSWADGTEVVLGEDAIDFDITLQSIDRTKQIATLLVRHVPPAQPRIKLPARWMSAPVGSAANNWVQVEKGSDGKYVAAVGQETFDVKIKIALATGRIISATMDNPVDVLERNCNDSALTACGTPNRYRIQRQIALDAQP